MTKIDKVKDHLKKYAPEYIGGAAAVVGIVLIVRGSSSSRLNLKAVKMAQIFKESNTQYMDVPLRYAFIPKGSSWFQTTEEIAKTLEIGKKYTNIPLTAPVVYGPSILFQAADELVAVFPL